MTKDIDIQLLGDEEIIKVLRGLPGKMGKSFVQRAWIKAAKPVVKAQRAGMNFKNPTGNAHKSIGKVRGKSYKSPTVFVGPRKGIKNDAFYLRFLWDGTKHISPKTGLQSYEASVMSSLSEAKALFAREIRLLLEKEWRKAR